MSYVWNRGGQPLVGPTPPNTNRVARGVIGASPQIDTRHYTPNQIRNLQAAYAAPSVTPLAPAFHNVPNHNPFGWAYSYEFEAPDDTSVDGYPSVFYSNGLSIPPISNAATISRGGIIRLGPSTDPTSGLPMFRHSLYPGDPVRHDAYRSECSYDSISIVRGEENWMAGAFRPDSNWTVASSSGDDRQSLGQIHQQNTTHNIGGVLGIVWENGVFKLVTTNSDIPSATTRCTNMMWTPGGMIRYILHVIEALSGDGVTPVCELWLGYGTGSMVLQTDLAPGAFFGDSDTSTSNPDFWKTGSDKYGLSMGSRAYTGYYYSMCYYGQGPGLYNAANAALVNGGFVTA